MIRSILIFVYIAVVLLASGLAQAADYAQIKYANFDQGSYLLHVRGVFLNTCHHAPRPEVAQTIESAASDVVVIGVRVNKSEDAACAQRISGQYDLVFDIRALRLKPNRDLSLKFVNYVPAIADSRTESITVRIAHENNGVQFASMEATGLLVEVPMQGFSSEAQYALVNEDGRAVYVRSLVDLGDYMDRQVRIAGIPLSHLVASESGALDLNDDKRTGEQPEKVLATEVSLIPSFK